MSLNWVVSTGRCYSLSTLEDVLKPCGIRCEDIKKCILSNCVTDRDHLNEILQKLYFKYTPTKPFQTKSVLYKYGEDNLVIVILAQGDNNRPLIDVLQKGRNYSDNFTYSHLCFDKIHIVYRCFNKCFCDFCLNDYLEWWLDGADVCRFYVFNKFYIMFQEKTHWNGLSLLHSSIKALIKPIKCCDVYMSRQNFVWMGDGVDPTNSLCRFSNPYPTIIQLNKFAGNLVYRDRFTRSRRHTMHPINWTNLLLYETFLVVDASDEILYLYSRRGYILTVEDFPKGIFYWFKTLYLGERDVVLVSRYQYDYRANIVTEALMCVTRLC